MTDQPEKVSSPSAALPDVRALIAEAEKRVAFLTSKERGYPALPANHPDVALIRDLSAALRSREGERGQLAALRALVKHAWIHEGYPRCGYDQMTTAQKALYDEIAAESDDEITVGEGERAEPADAPSCTNPLCGCSDRQEVIAALRSRSNDYLADLLQEWHDEEDLDPADHRWSRALLHETIRRLRPAQPEEAAQRATPSAPTPNDEKRAALADPSGIQERND